MTEQAQDLPLSDISSFGQDDYSPRKEERAIYLYIIETLKDGDWKVIEKDKLQLESKYFTQNDIDVVYAKYANDSNFRIVIYDTSLSDFTDKILRNEIVELTCKVEKFKEGIRIAETEGFGFQTFEKPFVCEVSKTTGLVLELFIDDDDGEEFLVLKLNGYTELNLKPEERDSPLAFEIIHSKLKVALYKLKSKLLDLKHRESTKNKRRHQIEILSSIWHGSTAPNKDMVYLLEFHEGQPCFKKYELKEVKHYDSDKAIEKEWFHAPIYLQHGEVKRMGLPVSNFGFLGQFDLDQYREVDEELLDYEEKMNFKCRDFIESLGYLKIQTDFLGDIRNGGKSRIELIEWCKAWFKGDVLSARHAIKILYGDANYLIEVGRPDGVRENPPLSGDLNYLEDRQRLSNIWNVI